MANSLYVFLPLICTVLGEWHAHSHSYDGRKYGKINVITQDNYEFLRDSFFRYSLLLQKEGVHTPGNSVGEGIANLYDEMNTLVGDELHPITRKIRTSTRCTCNSR